MMGDEFGGPVPVGPFRLIGSEAIGKGVVETLKKYPKSPAVLDAETMAPSPSARMLKAPSRPLP